MTRANFIESIRARTSERLAILAAKGHAYSGDADAFANFKRNAEAVGLTKYQILLVYMRKHIDAITTAIKDNPNSPVDKSESIIGRIDDAVNYLDLLAGMLEEDMKPVEIPLPYPDTPSDDNRKTR